MTESRRPYGHRELGPLAQMFEDACENKVFGTADPDRDPNDKTNIPVHVRQTPTPALSHAKIEAGPGLRSPTFDESSDEVTMLNSMQLTIDFYEQNNDIHIGFGGEYFDAPQFEMIASRLKNRPGFKIEDEKAFKILMRNPNPEKMQELAEAWRDGIHESLLELGYTPA